MTMTYSEARQRVLFKAARDLRQIAAGVLDDVENDVEVSSLATVMWAKSVAAKTAELANELEGRGHEECWADTRISRLQAKSKDDYSRAIDDFEARIAAVGGAR